MLLVREVFQAKYGRGDELVALLKEWFERTPAGRQVVAEGGGYRLLTDASGSFFTVVAEMEVADFAAWERVLQGFLTDPASGEWFTRSIEVTESGRREFYSIVP
jgi:hypothetical protein